MKKSLIIIKNTLTWLVVAIAVCMMIFTIISVNTFDRNDRNIFGYKAFIVRTDSMSKTDFSAGDLVFTKNVDPATLKAGDIITYQSTNTENYGAIVTHKIRELTEDDKGNPGFITYGTTTGVNDENIVTYGYVLGKYTGRLRGVGKFFDFLTTTPGYIVCIFLPFLILILVEGFNSIRLFRKCKMEQQAELQAEKDKIAADRAKTQKMLAELLAMRAYMQKQAKKKSEEAENKTEQSDKEP